jgi:hypothetical protein
MKTQTLLLSFAALSMWTASAQVNIPTQTTSSAPVAEGSTPTHRSDTDTDPGQVYIYVGGSLPAGTHLLELQYLFDHTSGGNTHGYITPLLFEFKPVESFTVFTVVGIGKGFEVQLGSAPQAIPFDVIEGIEAPTSGNFTFGWVTALVDSSGVQVVSSQGVVDFDTPSDPGHGSGGQLTTNDWAFDVGGQGNPVVALGTTFSVYGGDYVDYVLNYPPATQSAQSYRTYSAQAIGVVPAQ